jgi:site-specific recombinase XerD
VSHAGLEPGSATHLLKSGQDVRTNHVLMEHSDAKISIMYAYALYR